MVFKLLKIITHFGISSSRLGRKFKLSPKKLLDKRTFCRPENTFVIFAITGEVSDADASIFMSNNS